MEDLPDLTDRILAMLPFRFVSIHEYFMNHGLPGTFLYIPFWTACFQRLPWIIGSTWCLRYHVHGPLRGIPAAWLSRAILDCNMYVEQWLQDVEPCQISTVAMAAWPHGRMAYGSKEIPGGKSHMEGWWPPWCPWRANCAGTAGFASCHSSLSVPTKSVSWFSVIYRILQSYLVSLCHVSEFPMALWPCFGTVENWNEVKHASLTWHLSRDSRVFVASKLQDSLKALDRSPERQHRRVSDIQWHPVTSVHPVLWPCIVEILGISWSWTS